MLTGKPCRVYTDGSSVRSYSRLQRRRASRRRWCRLVDAGASVNQLDDTGLTALDWATACEKDDVVAYLTEIGALSSQELSSR